MQRLVLLVERFALRSQLELIWSVYRLVVLVEVFKSLLVQLEVGFEMPSVLLEAGFELLLVLLEVGFE